MRSSRLLIVIALIALVACLPPTPTPSPIATPPTSPLPNAVAANYSKLSVMIGNSPTGLCDFLTVAQPVVIYSINNAVEATIQQCSPHTLLVRRIQNDVWERLPSDWYHGLGTPQWEQDARISARAWAITRTISTAAGRLNLLDYASLSYQDWLAPINEPVIGTGADRFDKARWLNAWFVEWLSLAHAHGIKSSIFSFPSGEPPLDVVPLLAGAARMAAQWGDAIDTHEYGINNGLMSGDPESGALRYRQFHDALPVDARPRFIVSEASSGNGYDTGLAGQPWVNDMIAYGRELRRDPYLLGAAAFQLDQGAESSIPPTVLNGYATATAAVNWTRVYAIYLPIITK